MNKHLNSFVEDKFNEKNNFNKDKQDNNKHSIIKNQQCSNNIILKTENASDRTESIEKSQEKSVENEEMNVSNYHNNKTKVFDVKNKNSIKTIQIPSEIDAKKVLTIHIHSEDEDKRKENNKDNEQSYYSVRSSRNYYIYKSKDLYLNKNNNNNTTNKKDLLESINNPFYQNNFNVLNTSQQHFHDSNQFITPSHSLSPFLHIKENKQLSLNNSFVSSNSNYKSPLNLQEHVEQIQKSNSKNLNNLFYSNYPIVNNISLSSSVSLPSVKEISPNNVFKIPKVPNTVRNNKPSTLISIDDTFPISYNPIIKKEFINQCRKRSETNSNQFELQHNYKSQSKSDSNDDSYNNMQMNSNTNQIRQTKENYNNNNNDTKFITSFENDVNYIDSSKNSNEKSLSYNDSSDNNCLLHNISCLSNEHYEKQRMFMNNNNNSNWYNNIKIEQQKSNCLTQKQNNGINYYQMQVPLPNHSIKPIINDNSIIHQQLSHQKIPNYDCSFCYNNYSYIDDNNNNTKCLSQNKEHISFIEEENYLSNSSENQRNESFHKQF